MTPRVALYDDPLFRAHDAGPGHPERPQRLEAVRQGLREAELEALLLPRAPRPATRKELLRVHTAAHVERVAASQGRTRRFDADTQAGPHSYEAALLAAGAAVDAVDQVLAGSFERAFCTVRPPGHHAEADRAMGFCLFNSVAVAAGAALERGLSRIAIIDWDVHHGNGTQHIFEADPRVLYVSSHEYPFYPGTGSLGEVGTGAGQGFTVNLPMPGGLDDADYARAYHEIVLPIGRAFDPELVLVSMGFDPHRDDPLAGMRLSERGFGELAAICLEVAAGAAHGRAVFVLEGGYDLAALAASSAAVAGALLGRPSVPLDLAPAKRIEPLLDAYRRQHGRYWPVLAGS